MIWEYSDVQAQEEPFWSGSKVNAVAAKHLSLVLFCFFALSYNADLFPRNLVMKMKNVFGPLKKVALFHALSYRAGLQI